MRQILRKTTQLLAASALMLSSLGANAQIHDVYGCVSVNDNEMLSTATISLVKIDNDICVYNKPWEPVGANPLHEPAQDIIMWFNNIEMGLSIDLRQKLEAEIKKQIAGKASLEALSLNAGGISVHFYGDSANGSLNLRLGLGIKAYARINGPYGTQASVTLPPTGLSVNAKYDIYTGALTIVSTDTKVDISVNFSAWWDFFPVLGSLLNAYESKFESEINLQANQLIHGLSTYSRVSTGLQARLDKLIAKAQAEGVNIGPLKAEDYDKLNNAIGYIDFGIYSRVSDWQRQTVQIISNDHRILFARRSIPSGVITENCPRCQIP